MLEINQELLKNPFITCLMLKEKLNLVASTRKIRNYINLLGWNQVNTNFCQIVAPSNRLKRYTYACCCKLFQEKYDEVLVIDETTVEVRWRHTRIGANSKMGSLELLVERLANRKMLKNCNSNKKEDNFMWENSY